jgi:hypothetical protein
MEASRQVATISALEAATDALMIALGKRPVPDVGAATAALKAREAALRFLLQTDAQSRPPDLNARLRRVLERDQETAAFMRAEMEALRARLAETRHLISTYRKSPDGAERDRR